MGKQYNGSETLHKFHGGVVSTWVIFTDEQIKALDEYYVYFPKADVLHMVVRVDIFCKAIFSEFITGICFFA